MTDRDLVAAAIDAVSDPTDRISVRAAALGALLGHRDGRDVRAWHRGDSRPSAAVRQLLRVVVAHPRSMRRWLTDAQE